MKNYNKTHILARLEMGFRTDSARLQELDKEMALAIECARSFGKQHVSLEDWYTHWRMEWDKVELALRQIHELVKKMDAAIARSDSDSLKSALHAWESFLSEDFKLVKGLSAIRTQAGGFSSNRRKEWNILACSLDTHLETIHVCAQASRIKLELLKKHSLEEVDQLVNRILTRLPNRTSEEAMDDNHYEQEYITVADELNLEHHKYLGFLDIVKALCMWVETPEERISKNRSLRVDESDFPEITRVA